MAKKDLNKLGRGLKEWNKDTEKFWKKYPIYTFIVFSLLSFSISILMNAFVWKETSNLNVEIIGAVIFGLVFTWLFTSWKSKKR